jgi:Abortive infection alpha
MSRDAPEREPPPSRAYETGAGGVLHTSGALARFAVSAYWRSARWTVGASARAGRRLVRAAANGETPAELLRLTRADLRDRARSLLGITEQPQGTAWTSPSAAGTDQEDARSSLRERGAELLRRSADVNFEEDAHPAYARILDQLAPDEGRILRLLKVEGPQPSLDVRAGWLPLKVATELVAPGLNMIGAEAGCRHQEDVPAYLNNLFRLGLIWFSSEPVDDARRYQVLEAQPEVVEAVREAGRAHTVRRSVELTPFGRDFCDLCLPLETAELEALGDSAGKVREPDPGEDRDRSG